MALLNAMTADLDIARKVFWLVMHADVLLSEYNPDEETYDGGAYVLIICDRTFLPSTDAVPLRIEEIDSFIEVVKRWPAAGVAAWCAYKQNVSLWKPIVGVEWDAEYDEAFAEVPRMLPKETEAETPS